MGKKTRDYGRHRALFERHRGIILNTQEVCALCGKPVDKRLKFPHPLSATVDHIIPIDKGGHPSDIGNLQLAHFACNRQKSNKLVFQSTPKVTEVTNRDLPTIIDWTRYKAE